MVPVSKTLLKSLMLISAVLVLTACTAELGVYKAYIGETREDLQLARVNGGQILRSDWINRYIDVVRFLTVDGMSIENPEEINAIQIDPGYHDLKVYFSWDLGSQRGLAPALVNYASSRDTMSRTLRFNALSGERYTVMAEPVFSPAGNSVTDLLYVDFWVEDREGNEVVSRDSGRYVPQSASR